MRYWRIVYCFIFYLCLSCSDNRQLKSIYNEWFNKEIVFPSQMDFMIEGEDSITFPIESEFRVLTHVDSTGCLTCRLNLPLWKTFMNAVDSLADDRVQFLYFLSPVHLNDMITKLQLYDFNYPVCIDLKDSLGILNNFPKDDAFNTFLLDKDNRVIAIGNPIHNPKIKELYLKIIQGQPIGEEKKTIQTQVAVPEISFTFGDFPWQEAQTHSFEVKNTGNKPLVIQDVTTSCGCITVDFTKEPVQPGGAAIVKVMYKADRAEYFNKTITIYGNAEQLPMQLHVSGNAK